MAHLHHPHLFSHEWFVLHPAFVAGFKKYGASLGIGGLVAASAVLVTKLEHEMNIPLQLAQAVEVAPGDLVVAAQEYFAEQFFSQAQQAPVEELPAQF